MKLHASLFSIVASLILAGNVFSQPPDTLWTQTFGGSALDYGYSVQQTSDGGYIIAGETQSFGAGFTDVYLIKTDSTGNLVWQQTFGGSSYDRGSSVQQTSDGGYIIAGYTGSFGGGSGDVYLIKTGPAGNQFWQQTFGGSSGEEGYSVQQTPDRGYIIAGYTGSFGGGSGNVYLIKTNPFGNALWTQTFGGIYWDAGHSVQQTSDGGYIIAGRTNSFGAGFHDVYLIKTDPAGNLVWQQTFGGSGEDGGYSVQQTADGGYIIAGETWSFGAGSDDVYLIKTDPAGNLVWQQTFGGSSNDWGRSVQQTSDGGYIIAGGTWSFGAGSYDVYLIRLESPEVAITLTPYNPPIQIPANGGSFDYNIAVANSGSSPQVADVWCMATLPDGSSHGPVFGPVNITLPAGFAGDVDRTQAVPASAPAGTYTYHGYVGDYPSTIWDQDSFTFEKSAGDQAGGYVGEWANYGEPFEAGLEAPAPVEFALLGNYPNPFNPSTAISFSLPEPSWVDLTIYDVSGRQVSVLVNGYRDAGVHEVTFDGSDLASGVYVYRLQASDFTASGKMALMK